MLFEVYGLPVNKKGESAGSQSVEAAFAEVVRLYSNRLSRLLVYFERCTKDDAQAFKCRASAIFTDWTSVHVDAVDVSVEAAVDDAAHQLQRTLSAIIDPPG